MEKDVSAHYLAFNLPSEVFNCWMGEGISPLYRWQIPYYRHFQRDGCPKIVNLGSAKTDLFYERKKYGFKKR